MVVWSLMTFSCRQSRLGPRLLAVRAPVNPLPLRIRFPMIRRPKNHQKRSRRAATLPLVAVLVVVLLGMAAFSVDLGYLMLTRAQLQTTADSAVLAAAAMLYESKDAAIQEAQAYASKHMVS
ncbi:MAG TPA: hypothetical protein EYP56_14925, partial [Planctomycetaceae bacterium]|nr:hypothetical protein [Planctomycetaceae bacterium]